jgi:hypothetical protein
MENDDKDLEKIISELDAETLEAISFNIMGYVGEIKPSVDLHVINDPSSAGDRAYPNTSRFASVSSDDVDSFLSVNENKNTLKKNQNVT